MSNPFTHSAERPSPSPRVGGFAPWSPHSPERLITARVKFAGLFVASVLFAACVVVLVNAAAVVSEVPAAPKLPAYSASVRPEVVCNLVNMECVMRGRGNYALGKLFEDNHSAKLSIAAGEKLKVEAVRLDAGPTYRFIEKDDPDHYLNVRRALLAGADLSEAQMFAMMNMSASHRHQAIWHHARLNIFAIPPFTYGTFLQLKDLGHAEKPEGSKYHKLTQSAFDLAEAVADELVRIHKIHAPILVHTRGEISRTVNFNCTCGWGCALTAGDRMQAKASRAFTSHLRSINAVAAMADSIAHTTRRQGAEEG